MVQTKHNLLQGLEKITNDLTALKKLVMLEFKPAPNGRQIAVWNDLERTIKKLSSKWDSISALEEIRSQREKK
ncbi:hypothetical protein HZB07_06220 [Candidatus Saganbacteria bacterium]|nr:hypothetical protein [Candidatus Saganbacteria bacterium]